MYKQQCDLNLTFNCYHCKTQINIPKSKTVYKYAARSNVSPMCTHIRGACTSKRAWPLVTVVASIIKWTLHIIHAFQMHGLHNNDKMSSHATQVQYAHPDGT